MHIRTRRPGQLYIVALIFGALFLSVSPIFARSTVDASALPKIQAVSAILIEEDTGTVLYQDNADASIAPASLTKLITLDVALSEIRKGNLDPSQFIQPVPQSWAQNMYPGSSLMFLGPNQRLKISTLLRGLVVPSGNDAAYALAYQIAGSVPAFARMMNKTVSELGLKDMHFTEPSGISASNRITAREYAEFCRAFIRQNPSALPDLLSVKEFAYPEKVNLINGNHEHPIKQYNRNILLWDYKGVDGLKTGYIDQSGYNMAVTAERDGMRLVAVVLGVRPGQNVSGSKLRALDVEKLLNYGFANYTKLTMNYPKPEPVRVWKGTQKLVTLLPESTPEVVIPKDEVSQLKGVIEQSREVLAPVTKSEQLGNLVYSVGNRIVAKFPLQAQAAVSEGGLLRQAIDSVKLFFLRIVGKSSL